MKAFSAFTFRRKNTFLHKLDPRSKFTILICYMALVFLFFNPLHQIVILISQIIIIYLAKSLKEYINTIKGIWAILLLIFILNYLTITGCERLEYSLSMTLRFLTLVTSFSIFFLTTTPDELAIAMEMSGVPKEYTLMFTMSLRFIPTLARDLQIILDALRSRGFNINKGSFLERIRNYTYVLVPLIIFEVRRSIMIAESLEARGFGRPGKRTLYKPPMLKRADYAVIASAIMITVLLFVLKINLHII